MTWILFLYIFWWARVCWPLLCLCRPFCIFDGCLDSNPESALASRRATNLATHLPVTWILAEAKYCIQTGTSTCCVVTCIKSKNPRTCPAEHLAGCLLKYGSDKPTASHLIKDCIEKRGFCGGAENSFREAGYKSTSNIPGKSRNSDKYSIQSSSSFACVRFHVFTVSDLFRSSKTDVLPPVPLLLFSAVKWIGACSEDAV